MKKFILLITMMIPMIMMALTDVPAGPVAGTWDLAGSPYMVNGEIYIDHMATLVIEPGVEVRFTGWYKFIVNGSLMAEGTESANILFTADDINNKWHGIRFIETAETSVLDYCIVEYGETVLSTGIGVFPENAGGGIFLYMCPIASISIKNSIIRNNEAWNGGGIYCHESTLTLENCEIISNAAQIGAGIYISSEASLNMTNSTIGNNFADGDGAGILSILHSSMELINNTIVHNTSLHNGGGLSIYDPWSFIVKQNIIAHNSAIKGGGIFIEQAYSWGSFSDNTIAYNGAGLAGGGVYCDVSSTPTFESDIIYFNDVNGTYNQVYLSSLTSIPVISYCNIQDSTDGISGVGASSLLLDSCVYGDPLFSDAMNDDFSLSWDNYPEPDNTRSACIDAGCPILPEPDGTCNDIGAEFFFQQLDVPVALAPISVSQTSFFAKWDPAFGALSYLLDVAEDSTFSSFIFANQEVHGLEYLVDGLDYGQEYFYRVRSKNTALTSDYSITMGNLVIVYVEELEENELEIFTFQNTLQINTGPDLLFPGKIWIYNIAGQLLMHDNIQPGSNTIDLRLSNQIIIVKVIMEGKLYQHKLLIN